ncbi:hypothetical protein FNF28_05639 [Cafeteria roenbergensis]|uniref:SPX domain-containing protein n=1 Tax=Cafeteria roenbergensis TaxID=33653 RepID=A0A5A8D4L4_CAFRO|nr:hypothetical protein FNF28_05639 [Cafeteria roenbergensis]
MKFGKTLAVRIKPALREHAIDYKALKRQIRHVVEELRIAAGRRKRPRDLRIIEGATEHIPASKLKQGEPVISTHVRVSPSKRFRAAADGDAGAANPPVVAAEGVSPPATAGEVKREGSRVLTTAHHHRNEFLKEVTEQAKRASRWYDGVVRVMHSKSEMLGREAAALSDDIEAESGGPGPASHNSSLAAGAHTLSAPPRLLPQVTKLQTSAIDLADEIADIRDFAQLCIVAMDKIGKKWDKRVHEQAVSRELRGPTASAGSSSSSSSSASAAAATTAAAAADEAIDTVRAELNALASTLSISDTSCLDALQAEVDVVLRAYAAPKRRRGKQSAVVETAIKTIQRLDVDALPVGAVSRLYIALGTDPLSLPTAVPVMVAKGRRAGPTLGITSALHGNELNGMPLIHRLFEELDCDDLAGTIVAVIVANPHGYIRYQRGGPENTDLNRCMPGKRDGTAAQQFAHALLQRVIAAGDMDYLLDLHTASFGRVNSLYVRADLTDPTVFRLALLQHPQIIVHNRGKDGTLRGAASDLGIHTLTVEIGNPQRFHRPFIERALAGVYRTLRHLRMLPAVADDVTERVEKYTFGSATLITTTAVSASDAAPGRQAAPEAAATDAAAGAAAAAASSAHSGTPAPGVSVLTDPAAQSAGFTALRPSAVGELGEPSTAGIMAATMLAHAAAPARVAAAVDPQGLVRGLPGDDHHQTTMVSARARSGSGTSSANGTFTSAAPTGVMTLRDPAPMPALVRGHPLSADPGAWRDPVICSKSFWIFTRTGGVLYVVPPVFSWVRKGDVVADVRSVFGHCVQRYFAPCDGIVIGRSDNPVCQSGDRIIHLGIAGGSLDDATDDGHP